MHEHHSAQWSSKITLWWQQTDLWRRTLGRNFHVKRESCSPLQQTPRRGLVHLPQSLHGQDLNDINDHTRNLKHRKDIQAVVHSCTKTETWDQFKYVSSPLLSLYLVHKHFQGDGHIVNEVIHWKQSLENMETLQRLMTSVFDIDIFYKKCIFVELNCFREETKQRSAKDWERVSSHGATTITWSSISAKAVSLRWITKPYI